MGGGGHVSTNFLEYYKHSVNVTHKGHTDRTKNNKTFNISYQHIKHYIIAAK
jgi:hypothetical protein